MSFVTCDLCDDNADLVSVVTGLNWFSYGGRGAFGGEIVTVKCFEDNSRVKEHLGTDGKGKVLVVDGGGSLRNALIPVVTLVGIEMGSASDLEGLMARMRTSECHVQLLEPGSPTYRYLT